MFTISLHDEPISSLAETSSAYAMSTSELTGAKWDMQIHNLAQVLNAIFSLPQHMKGWLRKTDVHTDWMYSSPVDVLPDLRQGQLLAPSSMVWKKNIGQSWTVQLIDKDMEGLLLQVVERIISS